MINVTIGESNQQEKPFPKLMTEKGTGNLFFFYRPCLGLPLSTPDRIQGTDIKHLGRWASSWQMEFFTDYNEPITIQNA
jgi:hypothetical protein